MKTHQSPGHRLLCLAILTTIALLISAGCTEPVPVSQDPATVAHETKNPQPATGTIVTPGRTTAPVQQKMTQPAPVPVSSNGVITIDPISDKNTGDSFTLTGTTSLPADTNIFWQIMPDTGIPPAGLDPDSMMSVGGNYLVTKGDGARNRISVAVELGRLVPGKYIAIVGKMKGDRTTGLVFEIDNNYGYTGFTLK
jgi:hypothetical protein